MSDGVHMTGPHGWRPGSSVVTLPPPPQLPAPDTLLMVLAVGRGDGKQRAHSSLKGKLLTLTLLSTQLTCHGLAFLLWPHLAAREAGRYGLSLSSCQPDQIVPSPPGDTWQGLETFLVTSGWVVVGTGQGLLPNVLPSTGQPPAGKNSAA